jgi:hypothetical protein
MDHKVYRIEDCADCIHNNVCKYIDLINDLDLPLDLDAASCTEYLPMAVVNDRVEDIIEQTVLMTEQETREYIKGKSQAELLSEFLGYIQDGIEDCKLEIGETPNVVEMCKETLDLLMLVEGSTIHIETIVLSVVVNEDIPFGQFEIAVDDGSDDSDA